MNAGRPLVGLQSPPNRLLGDALAGLGTRLVGVKGGLILGFLPVEESRARSACKDSPLTCTQAPY